VRKSCSKKEALRNFGLTSVKVLHSAQTCKHVRFTPPNLTLVQTTTPPLCLTDTPPPQYMHSCGRVCMQSLLPLPLPRPFAPVALVMSAQPPSCTFPCCRVPCHTQGPRNPEQPLWAPAFAWRPRFAFAHYPPLLPLCISTLSSRLHNFHIFVFAY
jgi:hypothetical protein